MTVPLIETISSLETVPLGEILPLLVKGWGSSTVIGWGLGVACTYLVVNMAIIAHILEHIQLLEIALHETVSF